MSEKVYELVAPATLLQHMCEAQKALCEEFIKDEGIETFNRVVNLVNDVSNVQRPTKKIRVLEDQVFIQAIYKFVLLAQGMKSDSSRAAKFSFSIAWKGITPARHPPSDPAVTYVTREGQLRRMARIARRANTETAMKEAAD
jgi:hypothetical protein